MRAARSRRLLGRWGSACRVWATGPAARIDRSEREGLRSGERFELTRLRRENAQLRMERDLLNGATAVWVTESGL
ncbi:hypothetical protein [Candidatus Poriferisodalis sp.]|uniref:hypothetical protein n=1 Tax=Candidatus Poriferisodalis sp. TaxID=3101277 RepID=UPI003B51F73D